MSEMMTKAFKGRVVELVDQAQHFAAIGPGGAGGSGSDVAASFREGLDATERESECTIPLRMPFSQLVQSLLWRRQVLSG